MSGGHGGRREGAGRKLGGTNKVTQEVRAAAQVYGVPVIRRLAQLAGVLIAEDGTPIPGAESEQTQVAASRELLDRAYGKAVQPLTGEDGRPLFPRLVIMFGDDRKPPREVIFEEEFDGTISDCESQVPSET